MKHLSLLTALMLSSSMVYAGWTRYEFDPATGVYKTAPKYSCLEMICEHDCVENDDGQGECCPESVEGENCVKDTTDDKNCVLKKKTCASNQYCNKDSEKCELILTCPDCQKLDVATSTCVPDTAMNNQQVQDVCHMCQNGKVVLKDENKKIVYNNQCVECLADTDCSGNNICDLDNKICSQNCLGKTERCGNDALGFMFEGQLYCYNTHEEFVRRCREAIPGRTSCSNNHGCFYASNYYNEDYSGNCHWGYFDYTDAQNWCRQKGARTLSKTEIEKIWPEFLKCAPSFGKHNESCYWTNTTACKAKNGNCGNARPDGYINAGGALCKMN